MLEGVYSSYQGKFCKDVQGYYEDEIRPVTHKSEPPFLIGTLISATPQDNNIKFWFDAYD